MSDLSDRDLNYEKAAMERKLRREKRRRHERNMKILFITILAIIALIAAFLIYFFASGQKLFHFGGTGSGNNREASSLSGNLETDASIDAGDDASLQNDQSSGAGSSSDGTQSADGDTQDDFAEDSPDQNSTDVSSDDSQTSGDDQSASNNMPSFTGDEAALLTQADAMAVGYDYEGAITLLKSIPDYESNETIVSAIDGYQASLDACVPVDVTTVSHIFYHSLVNDPSLAFNAQILGQGGADGMNAWMTTVEEFDKITQAMYDRGYVFVRLRDLVVETTDENGNVHFEPNTHLLLPPDKKALVLSVDDLSYYHSYEAASFPDKLVLDENGKVKCHYVKPDGTEAVGDFDVVPRLNTFLEEHPDGAYKGARGLIALTGYNGVFGYRTDIDYKVKANLMADQAHWLEEHPDFDWDAEVAEATKIADAIKAEGWEFASHTWGHLSVTGKTAEQLQVDNEKWVNTVQNIVGPVDTIIFAHGNDLDTWEGYHSDNEKYRYYKSAGYNFYCNVDSLNPYWVQITSDYVRQGRIDLDGYQLYQASIGATTVLDGFFTASEVFDQRRPTPVVANGQG